MGKFIYITIEVLWTRFRDNWGTRVLISHSFLNKITNSDSNQVRRNWVSLIEMICRESSDLLCFWVLLPAHFNNIWILNSHICLIWRLYRWCILQRCNWSAIDGLTLSEHILKLLSGSLFLSQPWHSLWIGIGLVSNLDDNLILLVHTLK